MRFSYIVFNGVTPTAALHTPVTTSTAAAKTMLQLLPTRTIRVLEWGISFDGSAAGTPIRCELIHTTTVAATVTAHVAAGVQPYNENAADAALVTLSASGTGYSASAEGTVTGNTRIGDMQLIAPTNQYVKQWPLGEAFQMPANGVLRVRVHNPGTAVNAYCYIVFAQ